MAWSPPGRWQTHRHGDLPVFVPGGAQHVKALIQKGDARVFIDKKSIRGT
jgi:hypothetical protein